MSTKVKETILRLVRHGLTILAGYIAGKDLFTGFDFEPIISVVITWLALSLSSKSDKKLVAAEK